MGTQPPAMLARVVQRLVRAFAPERILLYGSYAKGTSHPGSDIDLLVVADLDGDIADHLRRARRIAADCFPHVDVFFATPEEVESATGATAPFLCSILPHSRTLYDRSSG